MTTIQTTYIAYHCSAQLLADSQQFITKMNKDIPEKENKLLARTICLFADETLDAYLVDIFHKIALTRSQQRIMRTGESVIRASSHTLVKGITKKLDYSQQKDIARHLESIILPLQEERLHQTAFVAFPINADLYAHILNTYQETTENAHPNNRQKLIQCQHKVIDLMFSALVDELLAQLKLAPTASKMALAARNRCKKIMHNTVEKLLTIMNEEELVASCSHFQKMLISADFLDQNKNIPKDFGNDRV